MPREGLAPAKINLALHVTGRRSDGYHELDTLVVFASAGDGLSLHPAQEDKFLATGPFAGALGDPGDNLVIRARDLARKVAAEQGIDVGSLSIILDKRLPVASGIGGGSSDAAAVLRAIAGLHFELEAPLLAAASSLGADVPMCMAAQPLRARGAGEILEPVRRFPSMAMLLVNPGVAVSTAEVFRLLQNRSNPGLPPLPQEGLTSMQALAGYLRTTRNDLEAAATCLAPVIAEIRRSLEATGAAFARMSGSGATVFGLYNSRQEAERARWTIAASRPDWWVESCVSLEAPGPNQ